MINQCVSQTRLLDLPVSALIPLLRMTYHTGAHHVQIHIYQALNEMLVGLHSRCMVSVLPKGPFALLPLVVFLSRSSCNELHGSRNNLPLSPVENEKMDVVGSGHVVQDAKPIALLCLEQPLYPSSAVSPELQQKLPLMTAMGNVPGVAW
jgi:hypothetical protein